MLRADLSKIKQPADYQLTIVVINLRFIANVFQSL